MLLSTRLLLLLNGSGSGLVLCVHTGQLLPYAVVDIHELSDTAVDANGLPFTEVSLVVLWRDTLLVTRF